METYRKVSMIRAILRLEGGVHPASLEKCLWGYAGTAATATNALLVIVTVAAVVAAALNFEQQSKFHLPDDGVTWVDRPSGDLTVPVATISPGQPG